MNDDSIAKKVIKGLGEIGEETAKEAIKQTGKITEGIITGQELFGVKPMSDEELAMKKADDEKKKQEEMARLRQGFGGQGRNVEEEIKRIREEKKQEEEEKERRETETARQQQRAETESQQVAMVPGNAKREAAKRQFAPGKKKKQQPTADQTSQTSEFKGGKID